VEEETPTDRQTPDIAEHHTTASTTPATQVVSYKPDELQDWTAPGLI